MKLKLSDIVHSKPNVVSNHRSEMDKEVKKFKEAMFEEICLCFVNQSTTVVPCSL